MKIFLDSSKIDEIKEAKTFGILDGVTTNPSLIKKAVEYEKKAGKKINMKKYIAEICKTVGRGKSVSLEVIGDNYKDLVKEGVKLHNMFNPVANNVYIKIPVSPALKEDDETMFDGIKAIKTLSNKKIRVNTTLIFTPEQALLAAKAGAKFVSPFVGREDDYLRKMAKIKFEKRDYFPQEGIILKGEKIRDEGIVSGIDLIRNVRQIFDNYNIKTEILAASIRNKISVWEAAAAGSDIATMSMDTMKKLLYHKKTSEGIKKFTTDTVPEYKELVRGK